MAQAIDIYFFGKLLNKTIILFACALPEEIKDSKAYIARNFLADKEIDTMLENLSWEQQRQGNSRVDTSPASAFSLTKSLTCVLLQTGYGTVAVESVFSTLFTLLQPKYIYYCGSALAISKDLLKGDCVELIAALRYDADIELPRAQKLISKLLQPNAQYQANLLNFSKTANTLYSHIHRQKRKAIALTGNTCVKVRQQVNSKGLKLGQEIKELPPLAQHAVRVLEKDYLQNLAQSFTEPFLVLDMESSAVIETVNRSIGTECSLCIIRVILDSIYDKEKINYREDSKLISKRIAEYFVPLLLAHIQLAEYR